MLKIIYGTVPFREAALFLRVYIAFSSSESHSQQPNTDTATKAPVWKCPNSVSTCLTSVVCKKLLCSSRALWGFGRSSSTPSRTLQETLIMKLTWRINDWAYSASPFSNPQRSQWRRGVSAGIIEGRSARWKAIQVAAEKLSLLNACNDCFIPLWWELRAVLWIWVTH